MFTSDKTAGPKGPADHVPLDKAIRDRLCERLSPRRVAYIRRVLTAGELSVVADPADALVIARIKRMSARRLSRFERLEPVDSEDRRLFGWLQLRWIRDEEYLLGTRLGRAPTHRELFADFTRHRNGPRFRAYFALKCPHRVRPIRRPRSDTAATHAVA